MSIDLYDFRDKLKLPVSIIKGINFFKAKINKEEPNSFWDCQSMFSELLKENEAWEQLINDCVLEETYHLKVNHGMLQDSSLLIHMSPNFSLSLSSTPKSVSDNVQGYDSQDEYIISSGCHLMVGVLSDSIVELDILRTEEDRDLDVYSSSLKIKRSTSYKLRKGDFVLVDGTKEMIDFTKFNNKDLLLILRSYPTLSQQCYFNRLDFKITGASMADEVDSRVKSMFEVLRELNSSKSISIVKSFLNNSNHYIRWEAIKTLAYLAPDQAVKPIKEACNDPHPHIRNAALTTIKNMEL